MKQDAKCAKRSKVLFGVGIEDRKKALSKAKQWQCGGLQIQFGDGDVEWMHRWFGGREHQLYRGNARHQSPFVASCY